MVNEQSDVEKLLGQINLQDFKYRNFGRNEMPALKIVRPEPVVEKKVSEAANPEAVKPSNQSSPEASKVPAKVKPLLARETMGSIGIEPPVEPVRSVRARDAFERLARSTLATGTPNLHLTLNLDVRPLLSHARETAFLRDQPIEAVFRRLEAAVWTPEKWLKNRAG